MFVKEIKDFIVKIVNGRDYVPTGLLELNRYFRYYDPIYFDIIDEGNILIAKSTNFRYGTIITNGRDIQEVDKNIKDAIMSSFDIPSSYAKEAAISNIGDKNMQYASA